MNNNHVFAIASITEFLKRMLHNEIIRQFTHAPIGDVMVTALAPDRISLGTEERAQLNLHVYRVTPNTTRQSVSMFSQREAGPVQLPLALDLHYLLAAYGEKELQIEALLGCAAQLFHANPLVTTETLHSLLSNQNGSNPDPLLEMLTSATFIDHLQPVRIVPEFLGIDDLVKLWGSWQTRARPALTYQVSMVLLGEYEGLLDSRVEVVG